MVGRRKKFSIVARKQQPAWSARAAEPVSDLQTSRLSEPYKRRLVKAGEMFRDFCRLKGASVPVLGRDPRMLADFLVVFINSLHSSGRPIWLASHAILAMQTWDRTLRGQLTAAWDSVQAWIGREQTPLTQTPFAKIRFFEK